MKCHQLSAILYCFILFEICHLVKSEFFTSVAELEKLLDIEELFIEKLDTYLQAEEERVGKLRWFSNQFENMHNLATDDEENFLANPVNAYLLVKRLIRDWNEASDLLQSNFDAKGFLSNVSNKTELPTVEDLSGAAAALLRLQYLYHLEPSSLASGQIKGVPAQVELNAADCFILGLQAYTDQDYRVSSIWFEEAWNRLLKEDYPTISRRQVLHYLSYSNFLNKNFTNAVKFATQQVILDPHNVELINNLKGYRQHEEMNRGKKKEVTPLSEEMQKIVNESFDYEQLCRGESIRTPKEESKLKCYYIKDNNKKNIFFQPLKVEVLNLDPKVLMFYNVLDDKEADTLKSVALPKLKRATVNEETGKLVHAHYRISKSTWLHDNMHPLVPHINRRVEEIAGLDTSFAEHLHVINYGIGGMYEPHYDHVRKGREYKIYGDAGNRIATWIFYLSDVQAGGSTVFPRIGVEVKPKRGAAVFWHNLKPNGEGDDRTMHAACPVLAGSKWIANKWLHERGNERYFSRK